MIDEFQDTNTAQYTIIKELAAPTSMKNIFVVADDDQIIYEWNGASYKQLERFRKEFSRSSFNYRRTTAAPPASSPQQTSSSAQQHAHTQKAPLIAGNHDATPPADHIRILTSATDAEEAESIAADIKVKGKQTWGNTIVLARKPGPSRRVLQQLKNHRRIGGYRSATRRFGHLAHYSRASTANGLVAER